MGRSVREKALPGMLNEMRKKGRKKNADIFEKPALTGFLIAARWCIINYQNIQRRALAISIADKVGKSGMVQLLLSDGYVQSDLREMRVKIMKQLLKKRIAQALTVLLAAAMITCFIPQTAAQVYAENGGPVVGLTGVLGTDVNTDNAQTVYYGTNGGTPVAWSVISYDGAGNEYTNPVGAMTLFAADNLAFDVKFIPETPEATVNNDYEGSNLKSVVDGLYGSLFSQREKSAIMIRELEVDEFSDTSTYSTGVSGSATSGYLWPLSTAEAIKLPSNAFRSANMPWWLRSPGETHNDMAYVGRNGAVGNRGVPVDKYRGDVRPAFDLDLSSVLFTSAAAGGKPSGTVGADALQQIPTNTTSEWKLTVHDSNLDTFKASAATGAVLSQTEGSWSVPIYCESNDPNAMLPVPDANNHVAAILADSSDNAMYYGVIDTNNYFGTKNITIPTGLPAGAYQLHVFIETTNGDYLTDYSSAFSTIDLTVTVPTCTVTFRAEGGAWPDGKTYKEVIVEKGKGATEPDAPTRNGYLFDGWDTDFSSVTSDLTVRANWKKTHTVTVNNGDGGGEYAEGAKVTITAADRSDEGKQFKGWSGTEELVFTEGSATTSPAAFTMPANDVTVTADYEDIPPEPVEVSIPTGRTLTYNGQLQTGVEAGTGYTLSDKTSATDAGAYQATATLEEGYIWEDGTDESKAISWKIDKAVAKVTAPAGKILTYNGKSQTGVAAGTGYTLTGASATNAGSYTAKAALKTDANYTYEWSDGTTAAKSISWKINKATAKVTAPAGKTLTYNGKTQTGVAAGNNYTLTGTVKAANAGSYTAKAALKTNANYTYKWSDGTTAAKTVKWKINKAAKKVTAPAGKTLTYNGKTQTGVAAGANYTLSGTVKAAKAGSYTAKAALKTNANYTYKWTDGTTAARAVRWKINKAANTFSIKARTATVKYSAVKKKAQTLGVTSVITFTNNGQGTRTYVKLSGNKKITVAGTTGQVTVQKKLKKGTYQVKVKVRANGNANYNASAWKTVTFTVRVK